MYGIAAVRFRGVLVSMAFVPDGVGLCRAGTRSGVGQLDGFVTDVRERR